MASSKYDTVVNLDDRNNSHTLMVELIGSNKRVLDVGCANGYLAEVLTARGCTVSGVEYDAAAAEEARQYLDRLVVGDLEQLDLVGELGEGQFDVVVFGDVLEHLRDPGAALRDARTLLRPGGRIVASVPNIAHGAVRLALLRGRWDYTDKGLLDRTHIRFFTLDAVCELLESAGLALEVLRSTVLDPVDVPEIALDEGVLPPTVVEWVRDQPGALDYQYVAAARALGPGEAREPRPALEPIVPYDLARRRDGHTVRMLEEVEERHQRLTRRDHVIGLEATVVAEQQRTSITLAHAEHVERRLRRVRGELDALTDELEQIVASRRPRARLRAIVQDLRAKGKRQAEAGRDPE